MAFLPEELARTEEGGWVLELPADHVGPLIDLEREITVGANPLGKCGVHNGFGSGADGDRLLHVALARLGHPRDLRGKAFDVVSLGL